MLMTAAVIHLYTFITNLNIKCQLWNFANLKKSDISCYRLAIESHHNVDAAVVFLLDGDGIAENVQDVDVLVVEEGGEEGREIVVDDGGDITQQARSFAGLPRGASKDVRFINLIWVGMCHPLHRQCQSLQIQGRGRYSFCFFCLLLPVLDFCLPTDMCTFMLQGRRLEHVRR